MYYYSSHPWTLSPEQSGSETIIWFIIVQEGNHGPYLGTRFQSFITGDKLHGGVDHERGPVAIDRNGAPEGRHQNTVHVNSRPRSDHRLVWL